MLPLLPSPRFPQADQRLAQSIFGPRAQSPYFLDSATISAFQAMFGGGSVADTSITFTDNTTGDVSTSAHGFQPKLPNDATKFMNGVGGYTVPPGTSPTFGSGWDAYIVKANNDDVTNSNTLTADSELTVAVTANSVWYFECFLLYAGDSTTGDYRFDFSVSAGNMTGVCTAIIFNTSNGVQQSTQVCNAATGWPVAPASDVDGTITVPKSGWAQQTYRFSADCNFRLRFAQNSATVGKKARTMAGSILRGKRLV